MLKDLIEQLNKLTEEDVNEVELRDEIQTEVEFADTMSLADTLDAKTKIARALENLKLAIDEFKEASAEKLDLLKDEALLQGFDGLDEQVKQIETALASGSKILGDSELNDVFKPELPAEPAEVEQVEAEDEAEEEVVYDFNAEAGYDLLHPEE